MLDMTKIRPMGRVALVKIPLDGKTKGGIHVPEGAFVNRRAELLAIGALAEIAAKPGDRIILAPEVFAPPPGSPKGSRPARIVLQNDGEYAYCLVGQDHILCCDDNPEIIGAPIVVSLQ